MATPAELEGWAREELRLEPGQTVAVSEKPGTDPRCSPIVTEVAIGPTDAAGAYILHIEHPLDGLVRMDLVAALAFGH